MAAPNTAVKDTEYAEYYDVNFDMLQSRVTAVGNELARALAPVYGSEMTGYTAVADGVVKVEYANGWSLLVNYNKSDVTTDWGVVPAADWLQVQPQKS